MQDGFFLPWNLFVLNNKKPSEDRKKLTTWITAKPGMFGQDSPSPGPGANQARWILHPDYLR